MAVPDHALATHYLRHISYYRLRAYWLPFEDVAPAEGEHKFKSGTCFDDVLALEDFAMLQGHVEMDEAYVGGRRPGKRGRGAEGKTIVMGMKQHGGPIRTVVIPNVRKPTLRNVVLRNVKPGSVVSTDELMSYGLLTDDGYVHGRVSHSEKVWRGYDVNTKQFHSTNHVESFWKLFKASVRSTHIHVSNKYMDRYLAEFTFRSNHRMMQNAMFDLIVARV